MTESEWLASTSVYWMLDFLRYKAPDRKLRLFAIACYRHVVPVTKRKLVRLAIETSEQYADHLVLLKELKQRRAAAVKRGVYTNADFAALAASRKPISASHVATCSRDVIGHWLEHEQELEQEEVYQSHLLRCVFGNPFRPLVIEASVLAWNDGTVAKIAQVIYDERRFADMPILADALEDADCSDAGILDHLRGPGPHAKGCWALDALLGKA